MPAAEQSPFCEPFHRLPVDMQIPPASVLSSWPESNYINPETRGPAEIITVSVLLALVTILLGLRVYTRLWISKGFGLDDVLILLAYVRDGALGVSCLPE